MSFAERKFTPLPLIPATQSALSACCAFAPRPDESIKKCDVGEQSSKCQKPKPPSVPGSVEPASPIGPPPKPAFPLPPVLDLPPIPVPPVLPLPPIPVPPVLPLPPTPVPPVLPLPAAPEPALPALPPDPVLPIDVPPPLPTEPLTFAPDDSWA